MLLVAVIFNYQDLLVWPLTKVPLSHFCVGNVVFTILDDEVYYLFRNNEINRLCKNRISCPLKCVLTSFIRVIAANWWYVFLYLSWFWSSSRLLYCSQIVWSSQYTCQRGLHHYYYCYHLAIFFWGLFCFVLFFQFSSRIDGVRENCLYLRLLRKIDF